MMLKRPPNALKWHSNVLKQARNELVFCENEPIFPRKWFAGNGLPLCHTHDVNKAINIKDLRPITSFDAGLSIRNALSLLEMRQSPAPGKIFECYTKYHGTIFSPPLGLGNTSANFSFAFFLNGLYSGSPTKTVIQLHVIMLRL